MEIWWRDIGEVREVFWGSDTHMCHTSSACLELARDECRMSEEGQTTNYQISLKSTSPYRSAMTAA